MRTLDTEIMRHFQSLGMESFTDGVIRENFARAYCPGLFTQLRKRLNVLFGPRLASQFKVTNSIGKKTAKWMDEQGYLNIGELTVYVPKGLSVPYLNYLEALENAQTHLVTMDAELLTPAKKLILTLINNPSMLNAASGLNDDQFKGQLFQVKLADITDAIGSCKSQGMKSDTAPFKRVYGRNSDLESAIVRQLALQDGILRMHPDMVQKQVLALFDAADKLAGLIASDELYSSVSKRVSGQLAEQLYKAARWVEFYGIYVNELIVSSNALKDSIVKLERVSKG